MNEIVKSGDGGSSGNGDPVMSGSFGGDVVVMEVMVTGFEVFNQAESFVRIVNDIDVFLSKDVGKDCQRKATVFADVCEIGQLLRSKHDCEFARKKLVGGGVII